MNNLKKLIVAATAVCLALVAVGLSFAQKNSVTPAAAPANYAASTEWPTYGHDSGGMRFSPLTQITAGNVGSLRVAWVYHLKPEDYVPPAGGGRGGRGRGGEEGGPPDAADTPRGGRGGGRGPGFSPSEGTPLIVDGLMYISSPYGRVVALDATTGKEA